MATTKNRLNQIYGKMEEKGRVIAETREGSLKVLSSWRSEIACLVGIRQTYDEKLY